MRIIALSENTSENGRLATEHGLSVQYMLVEEKGRSVLFSGCSHRGILNIAACFRPDILVGGFHFFHLPLDDTLRGYGRRLEQSGIRFITCHCTGQEQYAFLKEEMSRLSYLSAGTVLEI